MRARALALALAAIVSPVAALLPTTAAHAAPNPSMKVFITCDLATDTVSARVVSDRYFKGGYPRIVDFTRSGGYATTTTSYTQIVPTKTSVAVTTDASGSFAVTGYTVAAPLHDVVFYTETVRAVVRDPSGAVSYDTTANCAVDTRTTVQLTCDAAAHTISLAAAGARFDGLSGVRVKYTRAIVNQPVGGEPYFVGTPYEYTHNVAVTDGTWSDVGFADTIDTEPYYRSEAVEVEVSAIHDFGMWVVYVVVGRAKANCVYSNHRPS